jgi:uncharacterized membrane protein YbhN (UPF0104 family)
MAFVEPEPDAPGHDDGDAEPGSDTRRTFLSRLLEVRKRKGSSWLLVFALALFVGLLVVAFRNLPPIERPIRWELILIAGLVLVPVTTLLNALEYRVMAHFADYHPPALEIAQVSITGTAANLLPVPGAVVVRIANLRKGGVRMRRGLNLTAIIGLTWVGSAWALGGIANLPSRPRFGSGALALGFSLMTVSLILLTRTLEPGNRLAGSIELFAIEAGFVTVRALRFLLLARALRFDVTYAQTTALVIAAVSAAAIGFLPSGLGVREGLAALLSPVVGMPAAVGLVVTALDRVISLLVLAVFAATVMFLARNRNRAVRD